MEAATRDYTFSETASHVRGFQVAKMLQVAVALDLADIIGDEAIIIGDLARACSADAAMLLRLCRALAAFNIFAVDAEGRISHTPHSSWLRRDARPTLHHAAGYWTVPSIWAAWGNLEQTIRSGAPAFETTHGLPYFDYLNAHPQEAHLFDSFMQHSPDDRQAAVVEAYDFSDASLIVDIGGGNGALIAAVLEANASVRGVLFDQDSVVAGAPSILGRNADRCRIDPGNFFDRVSAGGDIYLLSQILHDWNDERCISILRNCRAAMGPDARLLVIERVLDPDPGKSDPMSFLADMHMMVLFPGARERTLMEYGRLFQQAGFGEARLIRTRSSFSIVETRPSG